MAVTPSLLSKQAPYHSGNLPRKAEESNPRPLRRSGFRVLLPANLAVPSENGRVGCPESDGRRVRTPHRTEPYSTVKVAVMRERAAA